MHTIQTFLTSTIFGKDFLPDIYKFLNIYLIIFLTVLKFTQTLNVQSYNIN